MGGSLRRSKKTRPKVTVKKRTKGRLQGVRAKLPKEFSDQRPSLSDKLGDIGDWTVQSNTNTNYRNHGFVANSNIGFGRNDQAADVIQDKAAEFDDIDAMVDIDDDFKSVLGQQGSKGPVPPTKLTSHQARIVQALTAAHGQDVEGMVKDRKLNSMLLPASRLKKMLQAHKMYLSQPGSRCAFRTPHKHL